MKSEQQTFFNHHLYYPDQKTEHVKWNDSYSFGIKMIDDQHMELLDFVNDLMNYVAKDDVEDYAYFKGVMDSMVEYIKNHFTTEEKIMQATKFPGFYEHKVDHGKFTLTVIQSAKDFEAGRRLVLTNFTNFLKNWVLTHIAVMDVQYVNYFKKIATAGTDVNQNITTDDIVNVAFALPKVNPPQCSQCVCYSCVTRW